MAAGSRVHERISLKPGDLRGLKIVDIGGGGYTESPSFGPDLARALAYLGAEVTLVDPVAKMEDFTNDNYEYGKVSAASMSAENFLDMFEQREKCHPDARGGA